MNGALERYPKRVAYIRIWLAPLLPPDEATLRLREAREIAESGGCRGLRDALAQPEQHSRPAKI